MAKGVKKAAKTTAKKAAPVKHTVKSVAHSIASLSAEDRAQLHAGFTERIQADNDAKSVGRVPEDTHYTEWANSIKE